MVVVQVREENLRDILRADPACIDPFQRSAPCVEQKVLSIYIQQCRRACARGREFWTSGADQVNVERMFLRRNADHENEE